MDSLDILNSLDVLTFEQEQAIAQVTDFYVRRWTDIALSTKSSGYKPYIMDLVRSAYGVLGYSEPQIVFCDSPYEASLMTLNRKGDLGRQTVRLVQMLAEDLYNAFEAGDEGGNIALDVNLIAQVNNRFNLNIQKHI